MEDACVSKVEFEELCDKQYPPETVSKTMRRERCERIVRYLKGEEPPPLGSWRYRIQVKGYTVANFPSLGLKDVLCLKGTENVSFFVSVEANYFPVTFLIVKK